MAITVSGVGEGFIEFQVFEMGFSLEGQGVMSEEEDTQDII